MKKRYQFYSRNGKEWTEWFEWESDYCPKVQFKSYKGDTLLCEYKD